MRAVGGLIDRIVPPALGGSFRPFITAAWASNLSDGVLMAAGPLLVASQTDSPALVASAVILMRLPWFVFGLWAGVIADRLDRRMLVIAGDAIRIVVLALLVVLIAGDQVNIALALLAMFLVGAAETFTDVATETMVPSIVESEQLGIANARITFGFSALNHLAGPPLGAALFAAAMFVPFLVEAVLLAFAIVMFARIELPPVERTEVHSPLADLRAPHRPHRYTGV